MNTCTRCRGTGCEPARSASPWQRALALCPRLGPAAGTAACDTHGAESRLNKLGQCAQCVLAASRAAASALRAA